MVRPRRREVRRLCVPGPDRGPTAVTLGDYAGSVFAQIANLEAVNAVGESEEPSESSLTSRVAKLPEMEVPARHELPTSAQVDPDIDDYAEMPDLAPPDDDDEPEKPVTKPSYSSAVRGPAVYVDVQSGQVATRIVPGRKYQMTQSKINQQNKAIKDDMEIVSLFTHVSGEEINVLPSAEEPEFLEVEWTADTGATVHVADKESLPFHTVRPSAGSRLGQNFQAAGGKLIANEGEINVIMLPPDVEEGIELSACVQCAKVTRPLLSISKITESGKLKFVCEKDDAKIIDRSGKILAVFKRKGGLYTTTMRIRNPRFQPFTRPAP